MPPFHHLAQVNVARMKGRLDESAMAGFVEHFEFVNSIAANSQGFVWKPEEADESGSYESPFDDLTLFNLSVWENVESLRSFVYGGRHRDIMRQQSEWFYRPPETHMALWWIPAGSLPTADEAAARLAHMRDHRSTPFAFSFGDGYGEPEAPDSSPQPSAPRISYEGRTFRCVSNTENGDSGDETVFRYGQRGSSVWATYSGGGTKFGTLVAVSDENGALDARYQHMADDGETRAGSCRSTATVLPDGRLRVAEHWRWSTGDRSRGISTIEEIAH